MGATPDKTTESPARYTVHAEIASGGMATVHLGRLSSAHGFSRTVAIKELHERLAANKEFVGRFIDEARLVARIRHPNVLPTLDIVSDDKGLRIVMEYVAGESLDHVAEAMAARGEVTPPRIACAIMVGVLHGLHAAHEAKNEFGEPLGIVHLDVSPQNILVGADGVPRVLDFGIARAHGARASAEMVGKVAYMAPEQVRGADVSPRTDVFAAGIVLWEMLTGERLFAADNPAATIQRVLSAPVPALVDKVPSMPVELSDVLKRALAREPSQRFATAREMALALEKIHSLASASELAAWLESACSDTLKARATLVQSMESAAARPSASVEMFVSARELYADYAASNIDRPTYDAAGTAALLGPARPRNSMVPQRAVDGSVQWKRVATPEVPDAQEAPKRTKRPRSPWRFVALGVLVLLVLLLVARIVFLPGYLRDAAIDSAAEQGVVLSVDDVNLDGQSVVMRGLVVKLEGVPQASATIASATALLSWSGPIKVTLGNVEVVVDGDVHAVTAALAAWFQVHHGAPPSKTQEPRPALVEMPTAHLLWTSPLGTDITRLELGGLQGTITPSASQRTGDEFHFWSPRLTFDTPSGRFGPWNFDVDQAVTGRRVRAAFDPAVPDGPGATLFLDAHAGTTFDIEVPHVPTARLGLPLAPFGATHPLPKSLACKLHYSHPFGAGVVASLDASLFGLRVPGLANNADAHLAGDVSGPKGTALAVRHGVASVGPLVATVTGMVTLDDDDGGAANLAWKAEPEPCSSLAVLPSAGAAVRDLAGRTLDGEPPDLGALLRDVGGLTEAAGVVKLTGTFSASGTAVLDSADLRHPTFTVVAKNACGVALFQGK